MAFFLGTLCLKRSGQAGQIVVAVGKSYGSVKSEGDCFEESVKIPVQIHFSTFLWDGVEKENSLLY